MTRVHHLKTWPEPFQAVIDGRKRHEVRVDDRGFAVGDVLTLKEWDPIEVCASCLHKPHVHSVCTGRSGGTAYQCMCVCPTSRARGYTGREVTVRVLYLTAAGSWGLPADRCVMSIEIEHTRRAP